MQIIKFAHTVLGALNTYSTHTRVVILCMCNNVLKAANRLSTQSVATFHGSGITFKYYAVLKPFGNRTYNGWMTTQYIACSRVDR